LPDFDAARGAGKKVEPVRSEPFHVERVIEHEDGGGRGKGGGCRLKTKYWQPEYGNWQ